MVTPGVLVVSVAEIAVSFAQPLFLTPRFSFTHSARLTMPLLLPSESSMAKPFASSFDVPAIWKPCVTVLPPGGATGAEAGVDEVELWSGSAAVAGQLP